MPCIADFYFPLLFSIPFSLFQKHRTVCAFLFHECLMIAILYDSAILHHQDSIHSRAQTDAMRNDNRRLILYDIQELIQDLRFRHRIQGAGRFIQQNPFAVFENAPGNGYFLPLSVGKLLPVQPLTQSLIQLTKKGPSSSHCAKHA